MEEKEDNDFVALHSFTTRNNKCPLVQNTLDSWWENEIKL